MGLPFEGDAIGPVDISADTWRRPHPVPGVDELSRTHLELVAAVQRTYLDLIFFFIFIDLETM
jgi:hypothetical protein